MSVPPIDTRFEDLPRWRTTPFKWSPRESGILELQYLIILQQIRLSKPPRPPNKPQIGADPNTHYSITQDDNGIPISVRKLFDNALGQEEIPD